MLILQIAAGIVLGFFVIVFLCTWLQHLMDGY